MTDVTIYHNPRCTTSRKTLALLAEHGVEPTIIEYLKTPPDAAELKRLLAMLGMSPRQLLRKKEAKEAGLDDPALNDAQLIAGMVENPIVIERPIVVKGRHAALGRPPEAVLKLL
jgi:arsenate reductase (glutaredoxin)